MIKTREWLDKDHNQLFLHCNHSAMNCKLRREPLSVKVKQLYKRFKHWLQVPSFRKKDVKFYRILNTNQVSSWIKCIECFWFLEATTTGFWVILFYSGLWVIQAFNIFFRNKFSTTALHLTLFCLCKQQFSAIHELNHLVFFTHFQNHIADFLCYEILSLVCRLIGLI